MKKLILKMILVVLFIFICNPINTLNSNTNEYKNKILEVKSEVVLDSNEYIIAIYQDIGSCTKCYNAPMNYIEKLNHKLQNVEFKFLAFVSCLRKKELKLFVERFHWTGNCLIDKGDVKQKLGIPQNSQITVFNDKYEIIINITDDNLHLADSLIYEKIKG